MSKSWGNFYFFYHNLYHSNYIIYAYQHANDFPFKLISLFIFFKKKSGKVSSIRKLL